ncbi:hypothetical protein KAZ93_03205 [Patescibacteria group bacterium]|nr:hypothetical protein [Patescibacteria group bacterium]
MTTDVFTMVFFLILSSPEATMIAHDPRDVDATIAISVPVPFVVISVTCADAMIVGS